MSLVPMISAARGATVGARSCGAGVSASPVRRSCLPAAISAISVLRDPGGSSVPPVEDEADGATALSLAEASCAANALPERGPLLPPED